MSRTQNSERIHHITVTAMLCAVSFIAVLIGRLIPAVQGFLSYDPKDSIIVIAGFIYGPMTSVIISVIVSVIEMFFGSSTGVYGLIMNVVSTCSFAVPAAIIYKKAHNMKGALIGLLVGMISVTAMMVLWNYIITPFYMKMDRAIVAAMLPTVFLPFNLIKSGINTGLTLILYKPLVTALRKANLIPKSEHSQGGFKASFMIISVVILVCFIAAFILFSQAG